MGSGLSMSSVNKIKELAAAHEYGLALDIVDSQDLSKSLNPQFLRLCGDIYTYNKRYTDARRVLIMAHRIAPEAKRIIFSLVELYLKLGYMELAKTYYDMYMFDADMDSIETKQLQYVYGKAKHAPVEELETYLGRAYDENIDYEWSYETFLVYSLLDKQQEALTLALEYTARFTDAPHCHVVADVLEGLLDVEKVFYDNVEACEDDDPEQEELRREENKLLEADHLRMYPPEPEIVSMVDDNEDLIDFTAKRKRKRFMKEATAKEQATEENYAEDLEVTEDTTKESEEDNVEQPKSTEEAVEKETDKESLSEDTAEEELSEEQVDNEEKKQGFLKRAFSKLRLKEKTSWEEELADDSVEEVSSDEEALKEARSVFFGEDENDETFDHNPIDNQTSEKQEEKEASEEMDESKEVETDSEMEDISDIQEMLDRKQSDEQASKYDSVVSDDFDEDGFEAESDSIEGLREQSDISEETTETVNTKKNSVIFEEVELAEDDEDDIPVDDFSSDDEDDEFGTMAGHDDEYDGVFVGEVEGLLYEDEETEEEPEEELEEELEEEVAEKSEEETIEDKEASEEITEEFVTEEVEEASEEITEEFATEEDEEASEENTDEFATEEVEETSEENTEEFITEEVEEASEEVTEEFATEEDEEASEEDTDDFGTAETAEDDPWKNIKKNSLEFPVFRSSLFPEYHSSKEIKVQNHFEEIMETEHSKLQESLQKEEQMQKEAEALLASLGIDLSSVSSSLKNPDKKTEFEKEELASETFKTSFIDKGPSRDELKASLKIDSTKRDILRKLKEYR